ncbi:MAG: flagellar biosynthesis protein FlhA [Kofleriaceae bacterium]|nr:flagellar biosynthesis protein FlhA [Kofleriaceae bacterium]
MATAVIGMLALMVVPLPSTLLDMLLGVSLCMSVLSFLVAFYVEKPLDFSAFPTFLLFVTLFRLSLNVASTRLILLHGGEGPGAAGGVIQAFGEFAVGGNFVVGTVVFLILVIVNFVVITKGAERISEVAARFTLDSMPGKQMAIDADLGSGLITEAEAKARRKEVEAESNFHGSMDGASKFVRGDAIAGLMITGINIAAGMVIGVAQNDMGVADAATTYTILSIGDGLVSQVPALLVSTGAALLITRKADGGIGAALGGQLLSRRQPLAISAGVLAVVGLLPGMPHISFWILAGGFGYLAKRAANGNVASATVGGAASKEGVSQPGVPKNNSQTQREEIEALLPVDLLAIDVGLDLLGMVDSDRGGELLDRIASLRKQLATELGLIVPPVHVRDDLRLRPGEYKVIISGVEVAKGEIKAGRLLAIDPSGRGTTSLPGELTKEPTFGLPAKWIVQADRNRAEATGCTVVDASAVIATHLTELIRRHAGELLGRSEAQELIDVTARDHAKVVEELIPHLLSLGDVIKVLRNLLAEGVSVRDMRTILETLADEAGQIKDSSELTELVRQRLSRRITRANMTEFGEIRAMVLGPQAESVFRGGSNSARDLSSLTSSIEKQTRLAIERDEPPVLVVAPEIRRTVSAIATRHIPGLIVLSYREIDPSIPFVTSSVIQVQEAAA